MSIVNWYEKDALHEAAIAEMQTVEVLLDIGCGIKPQNYIRPLTHICCEPYDEYINHLQHELALLALRDRSYILLNMGWSDAVNYFQPKSVDTVFLVDVIEHLEKEEGQKLLAATERIAKQQIVIFTPLGFMPQHHENGKDAWGLSGASWQEHKSGWLPEDFGEDWHIYAAKEFHMTDSLGRILEIPYGAMWAIKTNSNIVPSLTFDREESLKMIERDFRQKQAELARKEVIVVQKEIEIRSLLLTRIEYKIRRIINRLFKK